MMTAQSATEALELSAELSETGRPEFDTYDLVVIKSAIGFTAYIRLGQQWGMKKVCESMLGAGSEALLMERQFGRAGQAMVYAVLPSGSTTLVPAAMWRDLVDRAEKWCRNGGSQDMALRMKPNYDLLPRRKR